MTAPRKPSTLANLILLFMLLVIVGGLAGGGWYAYKKLIASKKPVTGPATTTAGTGTAARTSTGSPTAGTPATTTGTPGTTGTTAAAAKAEADRVAAQKKAEADRLAAEKAAADKAAADKAAAAKAAENKAAADRMAVEQAAKAEADRKAKEAADLAAKAAADAQMKQEAADAAAQIQPDAPSSPATGRHEAGSPEARSFKAEAKRRIDEAPADFSDAEKDEARRKIDRASQLVLISTVKFPRGGVTPTAADKAALQAELAKPEIADLVGNPLARVVILGFADTAGASQVNRDIAQRRAEGIQSTLKAAGVPSGKFERIVPIGETTLLGAGSANRAAEVWIAAP